MTEKARELDDGVWVLEVTGTLSNSALNGLRAQLAAELPGKRVLVLQEGMHLALVNGLDAAWAEAEAALLQQAGGSPYLTVSRDLMGWAVARACNSRGSWSAEGDTPAAALRALAAKLREPA